jgi:hypothetical protein
MTPSEFKAWFDGFTEALDGTPSEVQWKRIKARVAEIDGRPVTQQVYVDRYLPYYPPRYYYGTPYWSGSGNVLCGSTGTANALTGATITYSAGSTTQQAFDSHAAMQTLGRAEAQGLTQ